MMRLCKAALAGIFIAAPVWADGGITVDLPDVSQMAEPEAKALIAELANVNVITSNCPGYEISNGEWALITGTGDRLAARLGMDPTAYDRSYYGPAFKQLDDPTACDRVGPTAKPLIQRLIGMGGGTTPINQPQ